MKEVKCLEHWQMHYIQANHEDQTAQKMADHLKVEKHKVMLFCQANGIIPFRDRKTLLQLKRDSFHIKNY